MRPWISHISKDMLNKSIMMHSIIQGFFIGNWLVKPERNDSRSHETRSYWQPKGLLFKMIFLVQKSFAIVGYNSVRRSHGSSARSRYRYLMEDVKHTGTQCVSFKNSNLSAKTNFEKAQTFIRIYTYEKWPLELVFSVNSLFTCPVGLMFFF